MTRVLMVSSNGTGVGHLTRLVAYARSMPDARVRFLSLSQAAPLISALGYPVQYVPSQQASGMPAAPWRRLFADRLAQELRAHPADVVVFDGPSPYPGIDKVRAQHPDTRWVWSRRGMWKPGLMTDQLARASWFDAVIEPGDFSQPADQGATTRARALVHQVPPVTMFDRDELHEVQRARADLGLPADGKLALLSLGAGNVNDISAPLGAGAAALAEAGYQVVVTQSPIAPPRELPEGVLGVRVYPMGQHLRAFDLAVAASGYNLFHELLRARVPSVFVPNKQMLLDDQQARAEFANGQGWAGLSDGTPASLREGIAWAIECGPKACERVALIDPCNGSEAAARVILHNGRGGAG